MKDIEIIDIDYSGVNPEYFKKETIKLIDASLPFIVPDQGPFYKRGLILRSGSTELILNKDYKFEENLTELEETLGKGVSSYIKIINQEIINQNEELTLEYQQVGKPIISVKMLLEMIENAIYNNRPIDWDTQVHGKPATYPPAEHVHHITNPEELVGFGGLVTLVIQATQGIKNNGLLIWNTLTKIKDECYARLNKIYEERWEALFAHIQDTNNPHHVTKEDIKLGKHANWKTATKLEDIEGTPADRLSTPAGLKAAIDAFETDSDMYIKQGTMPFTYYGTGTYLPPPITGSFEGLGATEEYCGFCLEPNGWLVGLVQGMDGKTRNLYYIYNRNFTDRSSNWVNSYHKYQSDQLKSLGVNPEVIVRGSGSKVIMVSTQSNSSNNTYIALSNGTFNPLNHTYKKVDFTEVAANGGVTLNQGTVGKIGDKVYFITSINNANGDSLYTGSYGFGLTNYQQYFFYIDVSELEDPNVTTVRFKHIKLNYENLERTYRTNENAFRMMRIVPSGDPNNPIGQTFYKWEGGVNGGMSHRERQIVIVEDINNPTRAVLKMLVIGYTTWKLPNGGTSSAWFDFIVNYYFDTSTNTLRLEPSYRMPTRNVHTGYTDITSDENKMFGFPLNTFNNNFRGLYDHMGINWIDGYGLVASGLHERALPYMVAVRKMGLDSDLTDYEKASRGWDTGNNLQIQKIISMDSPFGPSAKIRTMSDLYYYNGKLNTLPLEIFKAEDRNNTVTTWYRKAEDVEYKLNDKLKIINKTQPVYTRTANTNFGKVNIPGAIPRICYNSRDRYALHHSAFSIYGLLKNDNKSWNTFKQSTGFNKPDLLADDSEIKIEVLLNYTLNEDTKTLNVAEDTASNLYLDKAEYENIINTLTGNMYANKSIKQFMITFYISPFGTDKDLPSFCFIRYNKLDSIGSNYFSACTFTHSTKSTTNGKRYIKLSNIEYPFKYDTDNSEINGRPITANPDTPYVNGLLVDVNGAWDWDYLTLNNPKIFCPTFINIDYKDKNNFVIKGTDASFNGTQIQFVKENGVITISKLSLTGVSAEVYGAKQFSLINGVGIFNNYGFADTGGALILANGGDKLYGLESVFFEGNWSVIINADMEAIFNGTVITFHQTSFDLRELDTSYQNTTFYLYAIAGKSKGKYEITKTLRTTSPFHLLVSTIETDYNGISSITNEVNFAISGFTISTERQGGIVPASSGTADEKGNFRTVRRSDLFDIKGYKK